MRTRQTRAFVWIILGYEGRSRPVVYCPCKSRRLFAGGSNSPATDLLIVLKLLVRRIIELKLLRVEMTKVDACNRDVRTCAANENEIPSRRLLSSRGETTLLREGAALSAATVRSYSLFPAILPTPIFSTLVWNVIRWDRENSFTFVSRIDSNER